MLTRLALPQLKLITRPLVEGVGAPWMWLTGKLNVEGRVDNSRSFNSEPWMWAAGTLGVGGYVDNTRAF